MPDYDAIPEEIEHLDAPIDDLSKVVIYAREAMEEAGAEIETVALVVREVTGETRVFWVGHPDHAIVLLQRGRTLMDRVQG